MGTAHLRSRGALFNTALPLLDAVRRQTVFFDHDEGEMRELPDIYNYKEDVARRSLRKGGYLTAVDFTPYANTTEDFEEALPDWWMRLKFSSETQLATIQHIARVTAADHWAEGWVDSHEEESELRDEDEGNDGAKQAFDVDDDAADDFVACFDASDSATAAAEAFKDDAFKDDLDDDEECCDDVVYKQQFWLGAGPPGEHLSFERFRLYLCSILRAADPASIRTSLLDHSGLAGRGNGIYRVGSIMFRTPRLCNNAAFEFSFEQFLCSV